MAMIETHNDSAREMLEKGIHVSLKNNLLENLRNGYAALSTLDSLEGDYLNAYVNYLKADKINDTLYNRKLQQTITSLKLKNQLEKEKIQKNEFAKQIKLQNEIITVKAIKNKTLTAFMIIALIFLVILLILRRKRSILHKELQVKNNELHKSKLEIEAKNKELTQLNEMKTTLFSVISHDLRSSIGTANQLAHLFYDEFETFDEERKKTILKTLLRTSDSLYYFMDNLLNWSKLQSKNINYKIKEIPLVPIVEKVIETVRSTANIKNINIKYNIPKDIIVKSNENVVSVILRNLLSNAIKFTPRNGKINIEGRIENGFYQICVKDNGVGIPQDKINQIFDFESDYRTLGSENENGSGFGLKLVKSMADKIDSKITVTSQEGVGSEFCFLVKMGTED